MLVAVVVGIAVLAALYWRPVGRLFYPFPYRETVEHWSAEYGVDPRLAAAVARVESSFRPSARSARGARGLMQVMPETGEWVAGQLGLDSFEPEDLDDPKLNLRVGIWYLAYQVRVFNGDLVLALAAYNGGGTNVRRWLEEERWSGSVDELRRIPFPETRTYLMRVFAAYERYRLLYPEVGVSSDGGGRWKHG
ncbi:lytic transglycosylase domain-containing protein [Limnochorda pilosa]|nr:lytic transglycosylase domain-containing protein [Limnochorda pilosa]